MAFGGRFGGLIPDYFSEMIFKYFTMSPNANKRSEGNIDTAQAIITASNISSGLLDVAFTKLPAKIEVVNATIIYNIQPNTYKQIAVIGGDACILWLLSFLLLSDSWARLGSSFAFCLAANSGFCFRYSS